MKRYALIILLALPSIRAARAQSVDEQTAHEAAQRWLQVSAVYREADQPFRAGPGEPLYFGDRKQPLAYRIPLNPQGYVVVGADRRLPPVLCFSDASALDLTDRPENVLRIMLATDLNRVAGILAVTPGHEAHQLDSELYAYATANQEAWDRLMSLVSDYMPTNVVVSPMVTSTWSQWRHYNDQCPVDTNEPALYGYGGRAPAGCTVVAGAQFMNYHRWPPYGMGTNVIHDGTGDIRGVHTGDFRRAYAWTNTLPDYHYATNYPSQKVVAVSTVISDLGIAASNDYNHLGTIANPYQMRKAFGDHFYYDTGTWMNRNDNPTTFDQQLSYWIQNHYPTIVSISGHCCVADGYANDSGMDYYHINFGWGGTNDGWYQPTQVISNSMEFGIMGARPLRQPLWHQTPRGTNTTGTETLRWHYPMRHTSEVASFVIEQGHFMTTSECYQGRTTEGWVSTPTGAWGRQTNAGDPAPCYYKTNDYSATYRSPLVTARTNSQFSFSYKARTHSDRFTVSYSTNRGDSWDAQLVVTGHTSAPPPNVWYTTNFPCGQHAGKEMAFQFAYEQGTHWVGDAFGVYVDNVAFSNFDMIIGVNTSFLPAASRSFMATELVDDTYHWRLNTMGTDGMWGVMSPWTSTYVYLDAQGDVDGDGIHNGWERQYYGSPTGAISSQDTDNDTFTALEEWFAHTDPTSQNSHFSNLTYGAQSGNTWNLYTEPTTTGRLYRTSFNTQLQHGSWRSYSGWHTGTGSRMTFAMTNHPDDACFFRVEGKVRE